MGFGRIPPTPNRTFPTFSRFFSKNVPYDIFMLTDIYFHILFVSNGHCPYLCTLALTTGSNALQTRLQQLVQYPS